MNDKTLVSLINRMTLEEKAALCSGMDAWQTQPIPRLGIPSLRVADGPHGVRVEDLKHQRENDGPNKKATCFPPQCALANSWDPELTRQVGAAIAAECKHHGVGVILGPGVNIKRSPLGGRNFEYYSEDPLLAGRLAAGFITGVQENGVGTSLKHFAVNNQEHLRMSINAAVDDRAFHDIYLRPFEIAVRQAQPDTVMASYNRVRGSYATENRKLLHQQLRLRFGFEGLVMSDWGAVNDRVAALAAGCDLEMPHSGPDNTRAIIRAVESGFLPLDTLDTACWNLLRLIFRRSRAGKAAPAVDWQAHHQLAADALCKSAVLLKNENDLLPLAQDGVRVAVIGELAEKPRFQGGGSSVMNPKKLTSFLAAMKLAGHPFVYAPGYKDGVNATPKMTAAAVAAAEGAKRVLLFLGLPDAYECEGYDRSHMELPAAQTQLLEAVSKANPNVVVVLCCGSPVATPWLGQARALLCLYLGGQALGLAAERLLYGKANPAGKLAESWPKALEDSPCHSWFPMGPAEVSYNESLYVGYRYYSTAGVAVQFPFGYGLSYTGYSYSQLQLSTDVLKEGDPELEITFNVKNTGARDGEEIVQLYLSRLGSKLYQPSQELAGFARVALRAGQSKTVTLRLGYNDLACYDPASGQRVVEAGGYQLQVGASSRDIRLRAELTAEGVSLAPAEIHSAAGPYGCPKNNHFPAQHFAALYGKKLSANTPPRWGHYTATTPLGQMTASPAGRRLLGLSRFVARRVIHFSQDPAAAEKSVQALTHDLPFKNLVMNTSGLIPPGAAGDLLDLCNGRHRFWRFIAGMIQRR